VRGGGRARGTVARGSGRGCFGSLRCLLLELLLRVGAEGLDEDGDEEVDDREVEHEAGAVHEDGNLEPLAAFEARLVDGDVLAE
jgi:hypothetical protein